MEIQVLRNAKMAYLCPPVEINPPHSFVAIFLMAVKLRLRRLGRTHSPFYHIVAADSRSPRDGKVIEQLGTYNPLKVPAEVSIDHGKTIKWLKNGAQPTETVRSILSHEGLMLQLHLHRKGKTEEQVAEGFGAWRAQKDLKQSAAKNTLEQKKHEASKARITHEQKRRAEITAKVAAKRAPAPEPVAEVEEAPASVVTQEAAEAPAEAAAE
jgi:small subunit ribosomal protein S16